MYPNLPLSVSYRQKSMLRGKSFLNCFVNTNLGTGYLLLTPTEAVSGGGGGGGALPVTPPDPT